MKKIVVITPYVPPNIINLYKLLLKKALKDNILLKIFCIKKKPIHRTHEIPDYDGLDISFFDGKNYYFSKSEIALDFPRGLVKALNEYDPDQIIFDGYGFSYIGAILYAIKRKIFKKNIRLVFWNSNTSKDSGPFESSNRFDRIVVSFVLKIIKKYLLKFFDSFAAGGKSMFEYLEDLGVDKSLITLVPRATFTNEEIIKHNQSIPFKNESKINFIYCGEISDRKGVDILFDAIQLSDVEIIKKINFKIYGNYKKSEKDSYKKRFSSSKLINYEGWLEHELLIDKLKEFDVLILPSRREPFGRIIIEALSCGLFILTQDSVGASKDISLDYLSSNFSKNSPIELNKCIKEIVLNIDDIRSAREKRIQWILNNWTHDVSANGLLEIIKR